MHGEFENYYIKLKKQIEYKRQEMIMNGYKYGLNHDRIIKDSQELDDLIIKAQQIKSSTFTMSEIS